MKLIIQRSKEAHVKIDEKITGQIDFGLVVLVGITHEDTEADIDALIQKMIHLRIFPDESEKLNLSLVDTKGSVLSISQFTLYADVKKGRRPNFTDAAKPDVAEKLYDLFNQKLRDEDIHVETGEFGKMMDVSLTNEGPVTITLESVSGKLI